MDGDSRQTGICPPYRWFAEFASAHQASADQASADHAHIHSPAPTLPFKAKAECIGWVRNREHICWHREIGPGLCSAFQVESPMAAMDR